jgi:hypothetical protein
MQEVQIINGHEYTVEVTENELLARQISAQEFCGYSIKHATDLYITKFYKCFGNEKKEIGKILYDPYTAKFHLFKYLNPKIHIMAKTGEVGINGALFAKLRIGDYIHFQIANKKYKIRVEKAAKVGNYKNFSYTSYNSELQFFIPVSELTEIESNKNTKKRKCERERKRA